MADATSGEKLIVDEHRSNAYDSEFYDDLASDTTSLASAITSYRVENGRRYHAYRDGAYFQPNDERAQENLDICHHLFLMTFRNALYLAPIRSDITSVLDVGTGNGIWAIDMADQFPNADVVGTDLSPIQPTQVPENCRFEIDDADSTPWTFSDNSVDFIHVRSLFGCISSWPEFYKECLRVLRPGGWIEQAEFSPGFYSDDDTVTDDTVMGDWVKHGKEVFDRLGKEIMIFEKMKGLMDATGFESSQEHKYKWPIGTWSKDERMKKIGAWTRLHLEAGLEGWTMRGLTGVLGWTPEDVLSYCERMRMDMKNKNIHGIHEMRVVYAQKPLHH